jgi:excisionase family DNA binding protein
MCGRYRLESPVPDNITTTMPQSRRQAVAVEALTPLAVPPKVAAQMLGYGVTHLYKLLNRNELQSYLDGGARRILVTSINAYVARKLEASSKPARRGPGRPRKNP